MNKIALIFALALSCIATAEEPVTNLTNKASDQCQCWSVTKSGNRCKRRARPNERYCKQHSESVSPSKPIEQCRSMTKSGIQCKDKPMKGKSYCSKHCKSKTESPIQVKDDSAHETGADSK